MDDWRKAKPEFIRHSRYAYRKLPKNRILKVACEIKALLHASRDCMRNQTKDSLAIRFSCTNSYYAEAFGILRGLAALGYGYFGPINRASGGLQSEANFGWWMSELENEVLREEGFETDHRCEYCKVLYNKDDYTEIRRKRLLNVVDSMTVALWEKSENHL